LQGPDQFQKAWVVPEYPWGAGNETKCQSKHKWLLHRKGPEGL